MHMFYLFGYKKFHEKRLLMSVPVRKIAMVSMILYLSFFSGIPCGHAYHGKLEFNPYYADGKKLARNEADNHGEMLTGFAFGITLPFFAYLTTEATYKNIHRNNVCGAVGGIIGASFWLWEGSQLIAHKKVTIPEHHVYQLEVKDKEAFEKGYREGIIKYRKSRYTRGVVLGLGTAIMIPLMMLTYFLSNDFK